MAYIEGNEVRLVIEALDELHESKLDYARICRITGEFKAMRWFYKEAIRCYDLKQKLLGELK